MRGYSIPSIVFVLVLVVAGGIAHATTMLPLSLDDLVDRSDVVAHVRVGDVRIVQRADAPFRATELVVVEAFQGARRGDVLELWQRGDGRVFVVGDPMLEPGQEGLAFLRRVDGRIYLTALAQSFWWIDRQSGEATVRRDLRSINMVLINAPRVLPPDSGTWANLRELVLDAVTGVSR